MKRTPSRQSANFGNYAFFQATNERSFYTRTMTKYKKLLCERAGNTDFFVCLCPIKRCCFLTFCVARFFFLLHTDSFVLNLLQRHAIALQIAHHELVS